MVEVSVTLSDP